MYLMNHRAKLVLGINKVDPNSHHHELFPQCATALFVRSAVTKYECKSLLQAMFNGSIAALVRGYPISDGGIKHSFAIERFLAFLRHHCQFV